MNQQSRPPRAARHRSSVYGPPPGVDPGTGYTTSAPFTSSSRRDRELQFPIPPTAPVSSSTNPHNSYTAPLNIDRISSPLSSRNIVRRTGNARPDPNIYDPIDEPIRTPRSPRERRLQGASSNGGTSVMFYPSSTTISSETSTTREDHNEPLPFFRTDPFGAPRRVESPGRTQIPSQGDLSSSQTRTTSMRSSGVLGDGAIQVDSDSSDAESVSTDYSVERQIVRQVSTVRRGQAQIVRNPSLRRSVVPDVQPLKPASPPPQVAPPDPPGSPRRFSRLLTPAATNYGRTSPDKRRLSRGPSQISAAASSIYSQPSVRSPIIPNPTPPDSRQSLTTFARGGVTPSSSSGSLSETAKVSNAQSETSSASQGRTKPRPPPLNIIAPGDSQYRSSSTSLPDLLDRATRLHDVLSTGRTTSMLTINEMATPQPERSAPVYRQKTYSSQPTSSIPNTREVTTQQPRPATTLGDILENFPTPAKSWPGPTNTRGSWPLNWPISRPARPAAPEPLPQPAPPTVLGRGIVSQRTTDTPSPAGPRKPGCFMCCFGKYDKGDRTPTSRLVSTPIYDRGKESSNGSVRRKCCGLPRIVVFLILILLALIVVAAIVTPIIVIKQRNNNSASALTIADCQTRLPCFNDGASLVVNGTSQCACLCAGGFTGVQCQSQDSSCTPISSIQGLTGDTSIGSAIPALIETAASNFSSQFTLSGERIVERFAAANLSCTAQNSLVNLNGSTTGKLANIGALSLFSNNTSDDPTLVAVEVILASVWSTTTIITTITQTFVTTVPFISTSQTTFSTSTQTTTVTSTYASSTLSTSTHTVTPTPSPTGTTHLSSPNLVFGRCVILAVVQASGVSSAAELQVLMESAINQGTTVVHDSALGLTIDLLGESVSGLTDTG